MNNFISLVASKFNLAIRSRTAWTLAAITFVATNSQALTQVLGQTHFNELVAGLTFLGVLFHVNPSQNYTPPQA